MKGGFYSFASSARENINPAYSYPSCLSMDGEGGARITDCQQERAELIVYGLKGIKATRYEHIEFLRFSASSDNLAEKEIPLNDFFFCLYSEMCGRTQHFKK